MFRCILCNAEVYLINKSLDYCERCLKVVGKECYECSTKLNVICTHRKDNNGTNINT